MKSWIALIVAVSFLAGNVAWEVFGEQVTKPRPYDQVDIIAAERTEDGFLLVATFRKLRCEYVRLRVVGSYAGVTDFFEWADVDGLDESRQAGRQTLRILIDMQDIDLDWLEVRTTHACPNLGAADVETVDRVFTHITDP